MPRGKTKRFSKRSLSSLVKDVRELKKESAANKGIIDVGNSNNISTTTSWLHTCCSGDVIPEILISPKKNCVSIIIILYFLKV